MCIGQYFSLRVLVFVVIYILHLGLNIVYSFTVALQIITGRPHLREGGTTQVVTEG